MTEEQPDARAPMTETTLDRRKLILGLSFGAAAAVTFARLPRKTIDYVTDRKLADIIPKDIGTWKFVSNSGLVVPTEDALSAALYSQLLTRVYANGDEPPIMLLIAQGAGQSGVLQIHRPEFCYPAGGFSLSPIEQRSLTLPGGNISVNELTASAPGREEQIVYWTRVGDAMPISWAQQRLSIAADNLRGYIPDAVLTRISTVDTDRTRAMARLAAFAEALLLSMGKNQRVLVSSN